MLMTRPIRCGPAAWARIAWPTGRIIPPPAPSSSRNPISSPTDPDSAQPSDPARNTTSDTVRTRRAPNRCAAHPEAGITLANARR
jgi:hypothetical protein